MLPTKSADYSSQIASFSPAQPFTPNSININDNNRKQETMSEFFTHSQKFNQFSVPVQFFLSGNDFFKDESNDRISFICKIFGITIEQLKYFIDQETSKSSDRKLLISFIESWTTEYYGKPQWVSFPEKVIAFVLEKIPKFKTSYCDVNCESIVQILKEFYSLVGGGMKRRFTLFGEWIQLLERNLSLVSTSDRKTKILDVYIGIYAFLLLNDFERCVVIHSQYVADMIARSLLSTLSIPDVVNGLDAEKSAHISTCAISIIIHDKLTRLLSSILHDIIQLKNKHLKKQLVTTFYLN